MSDLKLVSREEGEAIVLETNAWFAPVKYIWNNARGSATSAVAEYIANQRGLTFYTERVR